MKLAQLKALLAVIDTRNFSQAALELGSSQSAVSYSIAELERELGARLLERGRFGARPTEIGETVASHARAMLQHENAIQQQVTASQGQICGSLRVAVFRSAAGKILPPILADLRETQPSLSITMVEVDRIDQTGRDKEQILREHEADIAFIENHDLKEDLDDLLAWELMRDEYYGLVPASDAREHLDWQDLNQETFIFSECMYCTTKVSNHFNSFSETFKPAYIVREDSTILRMVSQNLGVSVMPELAIDELPENVKMIPMNEILERKIAVAILPSMLKVPAVRIFLKMLKVYFPASGIPSFEQHIIRAA